ncbi:MAG TPA: LuxR C-terminal-related transcriptional regulator [Solirubrobacteraceae bacterium]|nr:LuxR C-terminal-related transcriptional regulator [Solirubrobacteraceae bacterium]
MMGAKEPGESRAGYVEAGFPTAQPRSAQDLAVRGQAEREVAAHVAVAEALAAWQGTDSGFARLLQGLAEALDCEAAVLWVPCDDRLRPRAFWHAQTGGLGEYKVMTLTSRLRRGLELPGMAWQQLGPSGRSVADGPGPARWDAAVAAGFRSAIAFPSIWAEEVIAVIELVSREELRLTAQLKRSLVAIGYVLGHFLARRRGLLDGRLITGRQVEILELAAQGFSRSEIAERLVVSPSTVKTHFENVYVRLGVKNRAAAVAQAIRLGLVD